jgi:peptide chain release factor 1
MEVKLTENKKLVTKIIEYLKKLERNEISSELSNKKKNLLISEKKEYEKLESEQGDYQELFRLVDGEERNSVLAEVKMIEEKKENLINQIKEQLISEEGTKQNIAIEIRPGTGGTEAGLFARDLYRMYYKFSESKDWKIEMIESKVDGEGNFTFVSFLIKGKNVFNFLRNEAGVHRVQRVPKTENKGRTHTSTASVVVLPEAEEISLDIQKKDLLIETCRSSGAGGQHVNTTDSAVKITHIPTGIIATSQDGRSQHDNKEKAMFVLKSRLLKKHQDEVAAEARNLRTSMIGTAERSEKIRTYNYPQNRVTDHRLGISWNKLNFIMEGDLEDLCQKLINYEVERKINSKI